MRKPLTVGSLIAGRTVPSAPTPQLVHTPPPARPRQEARRSAAPRSSTNPFVHVTQRGQRFSVRMAPGQSLLSAALSQGQALSYKCLQGHCGKCCVQVTTGSSTLTKPNAREQEKLGTKLAQGYRLACQTSFSSTLQRQ
ncbi:2Fe-2S iron-sulfur cluster binding domain-containing protein [Brevibacillus nitrificans]|uniref:2Fe-2S iron-sulfur cluster binding domain-containing protein n=1 Tax=Brevibacillus nitrificans TaxID=651560 RepID=UPI0026157B2D|nr:2Fe-2S iron-sulfur cluster binding domain-containing protein [Brevibacillus nitrificans]